MTECDSYPQIERTGIGLSTGCQPAADCQSAMHLFLRIPPSSRTLTCDHLHSRRLPHLHSVGQPIFLTWRLHSSLPPGRVFPAATSHGRAFVAMDRLLDTVCTGPLHLRGPEV